MFPGLLFSVEETFRETLPAMDLAANPTKALG